MSYNETMRIAVLFAALTIVQGAFAGEILFEGFYRIERDNKHVGYVIQRLSADHKAGTKTLTTYIRQKQNGKEFYEAYKSVVNAKTWAPVASEHHSTNTGFPLTIKSSWKGGKGAVTFAATLGGKLMNKDTAGDADFLGGFLFFAADLNKLAGNQDYSYASFAEERGRTALGWLTRAGDKDFSGTKVVHLVDDYLGEPIENFVAPTGEPLGSRSPTENYVTFWVPTKELAIGMFDYPTAEMTSLFGDLPEGKKNPWSKLSSYQAAEWIKSFAKAEGHRRTVSSADAKPRSVASLPVRKP